MAVLGYLQTKWAARNDTQAGEALDLFQKPT